MKEIWKNVKGYEGQYQINNLGIIKSLSRKIYRYGKPYKITKEIIMKQSLNEDNGYLCVNLWKSGKMKRCKIHRLILIAFKGSSKLVANHKDGNKLNNNIKNLEWITSGENNKHAYDFGLKKPTKKNLGKKRTIEQKLKMSIAQKAINRKLTELQKEKISEFMKTRKVSDETRKKMSESAKKWRQLNVKAYC